MKVIDILRPKRWLIPLLGGACVVLALTGSSAKGAGCPYYAYRVQCHAATLRTATSGPFQCGLTYMINTYRTTASSLLTCGWAPPGYGWGRYSIATQFNCYYTYSRTVCGIYYSNSRSFSFGGSYCLGSCT